MAFKGARIKRSVATGLASVLAPTLAAERTWALGILTKKPSNHVRDNATAEPQAKAAIWVAGGRK